MKPYSDYISYDAEVFFREKVIHAGSAELGTLTR